VDDTAGLQRREIKQNIRIEGLRAEAGSGEDRVESEGYRRIFPAGTTV
jgi:hypothetical protein